MAQTFIGLTPKKLRPRADMNPLALRKEIFQHGKTVKWERAAACPCQRQLTAGSPAKSVNTKEPRPDCSVCSGKGYFHHTPQTIEVIMLSAMTAPERFAHYGEHVNGTVRLTFLPEHLPGWMDKVTVTDSFAEYREINTKTSSAVEALRYPVATRSVIVGTAGDNTIAATLSMKTLYCRKATAEGVVAGSELVENTDFVINADGKIDWSLGVTAGTAPTTGERYTISYYINPVYVIKSFPYSQRVTYSVEKSATEVRTELPVLADAWLEWLGD